jgi:hypothetical protein
MQLECADALYRVCSQVLAPFKANDRQQLGLCQQFTWTAISVLLTVTLISLSAWYRPRYTMRQFLLIPYNTNNLRTDNLKFYLIIGTTLLNSTTSFKLYSSQPTASPELSYIYRPSLGLVISNVDQRHQFRSTDTKNVRIVTV